MSRTVDQIKAYYGKASEAEREAMLETKTAWADVYTLLDHIAELEAQAAALGEWWEPNDILPPIAQYHYKEGKWVLRPPDEPPTAAVVAESESEE